MYLSVKNKKSLKLRAENLTRSIEGYRREVNRFLTRRVGCADTAADIFQSVAENLLYKSLNLAYWLILLILFNFKWNFASYYSRVNTLERYYAGFMIV